uniref:Uncharacterized protein LOC100176290 n=1 Tax=Phallusia mammillata TaxID=59560 RepID=A0A6F9DGZ5_9ASCI|nr:uncharacterized protein LOC100176290 [Phallusia mammillata]
MQMCEYTCPAESVVIPVCASATCLDFDPPITATCVANDTWNLEVPYCQKEISCMPFHAPKEISRSSYCVRGDVKWELYPDQTYTDLKNGTMCSVACWSGYNAEPQSVVSCLSTGEWNLEQPKCKKPVCPHLKLPNYVSAKCNDDNVVGSECKFSCTHGRQMTGPKTAACLNSRTWSSDTPSCQCPRCKTGPNCEYTTSWRQIASNLGSNNKINYAGHEIVCESDLEFLRGQYRCECWGLGRRKRCGLYGSDGGSCEHSLSYFIRDLMADGTLPEPCDKDHMATGC